MTVLLSILDPGVLQKRIFPLHIHWFSSVDTISQRNSYFSLDKCDKEQCFLRLYFLAGSGDIWVAFQQSLQYFLTPGTWTARPWFATVVYLRYKVNQHLAQNRVLYSLPSLLVPVLCLTQVALGATIELKVSTRFETPRWLVQASNTSLYGIQHSSGGILAEQVRYYLLSSVGNNWWEADLCVIEQRLKSEVQRYLHHSRQFVRIQLLCNRVQVFVGTSSLPGNSIRLDEF